MACYISSKDNRFYVAAEQQYGNVGAVTAASRFPAVSLGAQLQLEQSRRRDKTGGRTFVGLPTGLRKRTSFELATYLTGWTNQTLEPGYGPLFQGALGSSAQIYGGGTVSSLTGQTQLQFTTAHGLTLGQAVSFGGEIRFVNAIANPTTIQLNAPFSIVPSTGSPIGKTCTYRLTADPVSLSLFDYWSPTTAIHRIICGAAIDRMRIRINDDFHQFEFSGPASDILDSSSFAQGEGGLTQFPAEPSITALNYAIVPGHLGQMWLGAAATQFLTVTGADLSLDNDVELRAREFGALTPRCITAGVRDISLNVSLFEQDDAATASLYQAARQRSPIGVMLQLGQQSGQLFGIHLKSVVPEVPEYDDRETRLQWKFTGCRAQGTIDDELFLAFG